MKQFKSDKKHLLLTKAFMLVLTALLWVIPSQAQNIVKGTVRDAAGDPLLGASVQLSSGAKRCNYRYRW